MATAVVHVTPALVLRTTDYGEADRVVTLLTEHHGKVSALARGARRSKRRFGGGLGLFGVGEATLRERSELWLLEDLHTTRGFLRLGSELGRFGHASYACELAQQLCPAHEPEPQVFARLLGLLTYLDGLPIIDKPSVLPLRSFELQVLSAVGLGLSLSHCAACGAAVDEQVMVPFDIERGGVHCPGLCFGGPTPTNFGQLLVGRSGGLPGAVRTALLRLGELPLTGTGTDEAARALAEQIPGAVLPTCRDLLLAVVRHHLGRDLRVLEFITKLNRSMM